MKRNISANTITAVVFTALLQASGFGQIKVIHSWSLGEGGVAGGAAKPALTDTTGELDLALTGEPVYTELGSGLGVLFNNLDSSSTLEATEYFSSDEADVNPADPARWGFEAVVRIDLLPENNQELAVFELGAGQEGILLETLGGGAWSLHRSGRALASDPAPVRVGEKQHLAAVMENNVWQLYIDGVKSITIPSVGYDPAAGIRIGAGNVGAGNNRGFNGVIETVRVFEYEGAFDIFDTLFDGVNPDADGDGFDDTVEVALGFKPNDPASTPESVSTAFTAVEFRFYAAKNVNYTIEGSEDLKIWEPVETGIIGGGQAVNRLYSTTSQAKRYFRAKRE